ncbi:hypothetical protein M0G43_07960 [Subsaxibacter sp. CAU 1640]|uniref:hypothetical protein n=1 Tax=Subsaxibacter sp. CAU 1640 TaxID=2933271 RepID=UPI002003CB17|nr:hypothetical protein [Subsaxibacter sp. CAU 1640]MCK7590502.1 hypothetical protein [Subsaxibacter sp. CAU 1640]
MIIQTLKPIFLIAFLCVLSCNAQNFKIQEIDLSETTLHNGIEEFIQKTKVENEKFSRYGYVEIRLLSFDSSNPDTKSKYRIKEQFVGLKSSHTFPSLYAYVSNKLVLIYSDVINVNHQISEKDKKMLIKKIEQFLSPKEHVVAKDANGKVVIDDSNFRDEVYNIHGGMILEVLSDGGYRLSAAAEGK